ncbi:MAG TPA: VIT domain-containing protein, partial [Gemmataceae bacterium]|nr:VIT domain-containing protein [Gemmataceae bacterium]
MTTNDHPHESSPDIGDQNVERLVGQVYKPENPDPEFVRRVEERVLAAAREIAHSRTAGKYSPASARDVAGKVDPNRRPSGTTRRLGWVLQMAAALAILIIALQFLPRHDLPSTPQSKIEAEENVAALTPLLPYNGKMPRKRSATPAGTILAIGQEMQTELGQRRRVTLPDGSVLFLNQQTVVKLENERRVKLARGEVYVEVAPRNQGTPEAAFTIVTATRRVTALGTKFAVREDARGSVVVVTQGKVAVDNFDDLILAGQQLAPGSQEIAPAPRASYLLDWTADLMAAAESPLVPASKYAGGALIAVDPYGQEAKLSLRTYHVDVHIEDGFARTTIDQTYFNHDPWRMEGKFLFPLPPDASLSRLAMYVDGTLMEGGMAERDYARQVFETIMYRQKDPALLEWMDGSTFQMRVFPLEGRQEKRIVLSYTQRLDWAYGKLRYRFPAGHNLDIVRDWSFHGHIKRAAHWDWKCPSHSEMKAAQDGQDLILDAQDKHIKIDRDLSLELEEDKGIREEEGRFSTAEHEGAKYLMVRYRPKLENKTARERRDWVFLFESSGDRDPLLARVQVDIVRTLLENAEHDDTFAILTAGTRVHALSSGSLLATPKNVQRALEYLDRTHLVGALDLGQALQVAETFVKGKKNPYLVHVGSGIAAIGERRENALIKQIPQGARYVGVAVGKRWSRNFMKPAAENTGGYFTQINPDEPVSWRAFELTSALAMPRLMKAEVVDNAEKIQFLSYAGSVGQGEEVCAIARLEANQPLPQSVTVSGKVNGKPFTRELRVANSAGSADYLPRTWAKLEIDRLLAEDAAKHKDRLVALSKSMYVMTPYTSLLVLENEAMYEQFKVDRGRKDHWALYPCPDKIPVIYEPLPGQPVDVRNAPKDVTPAKRPSAMDILQTIMVRQPPRFLYWPNVNTGSGPAVINALQAIVGVGNVGREFSDNIDFGGARGDLNLFYSFNGDAGVDPLGLGINPMTNTFGLAIPPFSGFTISGPQGTSILSLGGGFGGGIGGFSGNFGSGSFGGGFGGSFGGSISGGFGGSFGGGFPAGRLARGWMKQGFLEATPGVAGPNTSTELMTYLRQEENKREVKDLKSTKEELSQLLISNKKSKLRTYDIVSEKEFGYFRRISDLGKSLRDELKDREGRDPSLSTFERLARGHQQYLWYQRPSFAGDERVFYDLVSYAPGLNTTWADIQVVLEAEAGSAAGSYPLTVEPAIRKLMEKARSADWQVITLGGTSGVPAFRVLFNGLGQHAYERILPSGLAERVVCDGKTLLHLYPELGIGGRRSVSTFHRAGFANLVPWALPPVDDLAAALDLKLSGDRTVVLIPREADTRKDQEGKLVPYEAMYLIFAETGRLAEKKIVEMPGEKTVYRETYSSEGEVQFFDENNQLLSTLKLALEPAQAPQLKPDLGKLVVLPLPFRSRESVRQRLPEVQKKGQEAYRDLDEENALTLFAAEIASYQAWEAFALFEQRFLNRGDHRPGFYTWLLSSGYPIHQANDLQDQGNKRPQDPLLKFLAFFSDPQKRQAYVDLGDIGGSKDGFLQRLVGFRDILYRWMGGKANQGTEAERRKERENAIKFIRETASPLWGWALLEIVHRYHGDTFLAQSDPAFGEIFRRFEKLPGLYYTARYESARSLLNGGKTKQALETFQELYAQLLKTGVLPPIDSSFRQAFQGQNDPELWRTFLRTTAGHLISEKHRLGVFSLAYQCFQMGDHPLAEELFNQGFVGVTAEDRPATNLAGVEYLWQTGQVARADSLLQPLLNDETVAKRSSIWRLAAWLANQRGAGLESVPYLEKAMEIEFQQLPDVINLQAVRTDYGQLMGRYQALAGAFAAVRAKPPEDFLMRVIAVADRWRSLDPDNTAACHAVAAVLKTLGEYELAWDYLTTPIGLQPHQASSWLNLAQTLRTEGSLFLAERAYALAFDSEPTNAQILWDRAQILFQIGKNKEGQKVLRQI